MFKSVGKDLSVNRGVEKRLKTPTLPGRYILDC